MKVIIGYNAIYDAEKDPIVIIFDNDAERQYHGNNIVNMPAREGLRMYSEWPTELGQDAINDVMMMGYAEDEVRVAMANMFDQNTARLYVMDRLITTLKDALASGTAEDVPEGSRYITLSDTLRNSMVEDLKKLRGVLFTDGDRGVKPNGANATDGE